MSPAKCGTAWQSRAPTSKRWRCSPSFALPMLTVSSIRSACIHPNWMKSKRRRAAVMLEKTRERYPPIDDVVEATAWWERFRMLGAPPSRRNPIERRRKSDATSHVPAAVARSSRSVAAVDARQRQVFRSTLQLRMKRLGIVRPRIGERCPTLTRQQRDARSLVVRTMGLASGDRSSSNPPILDMSVRVFRHWTLRILSRFCGRDRSREESTNGVMSQFAVLDRNPNCGTTVKH